MYIGALEEQCLVQSEHVHPYVLEHATVLGGFAVGRDHRCNPFHETFANLGSSLYAKWLTPRLGGTGLSFGD